VATLSLDAHSAYDPDDIFGVRRALVGLPEHRRDEFFDRWVELTEGCEFEVPRIHAAVRHELASVPAGAGNEALHAAWATVGSAMSAYLAWRAER
jgi:hypothetical protein